MAINEWRARKAPPPAVVTIVLIMALACGGGGDDNVQVDVETDERDGGELVALMEGARGAFQRDDFGRFQTQFGGRPEAKPAWDSLERWAARSGKFHVERLTTYPGLVRAEPGIHVSRLELLACFDLSRETGKRGDVYQTTWTFARGDSAWTIKKMRIDRAHTSYHELLRDMQQLSYQEYLTLGMDWEELVDPVPLMRRWLEAAQNEDYDAIQSRMVAGVYPRAFEKNIDLPTLALDDDVAGRSNRESARTMMEGSVAALKKSAEKLGMDSGELSPYFGAYGVTSMPDNCTKLKMYMAFDGDGVPAKKVTGFSVEWSAAYINHRWLIEDMAIKSIETTF